jgi:hypothetical protein
MTYDRRQQLDSEPDTSPEDELFKYAGRFLVLVSAVIMVAGMAKVWGWI